MAETEQLGFWELVHGTSAGGASIVAFETLREVVHGGALLATYTGVTVLLFKWHHWHLQRIKNRRIARKVQRAKKVRNSGTHV